MRFWSARRKLSRIDVHIAALILQLLVGTHANAEIFPSRPIKLVIPYSPGGQTDVIGRLLGEKLSKTIKQPIVIENRPGAGGQIGIEYVARSAADGYTLVLTTNITHLSMPTVAADLKYDPVKDFEIVATIAKIPYLLLVPKASPYISFEAFAEALRQNPGKLSYGSAGFGSSSHLIAADLVRTLQADAVHIPYKGTAQASADLAAGRLDFMFDGPSTVEGLIKGGVIRTLAISGTKSLAIAPNATLIADNGLPNFSKWVATNIVLSPSGTPADAIERLNFAIREATLDEEFQKKIDGLGLVPAATESRQELSSYLMEESSRIRSAAEALRTPKH
jgi:tripartite-type tricarboxylate transporter receptor subunit TctC